LPVREELFSSSYLGVWWMAMGACMNGWSWSAAQPTMARAKWVIGMLLTNMWIKSLKRRLEFDKAVNERPSWGIWGARCQHYM